GSPARSAFILRPCVPARRDHGQGTTPKMLLVERFLLADHVKDTPRQPRRQDAQRLARAVLLRLPLFPALGTLTGAEKQTGDLREGPAQMGIADLLAAPAQLLAVRLVLAAHQPRIRQELSHLLETSSIVHLVQEHQAQDWSTARDGPQPLIGLDIVHLGGPRQV